MTTSINFVGGTAAREMLSFREYSACALLCLAILAGCVTDGRNLEGKEKFRLVLGHEYFQLNACPKIHMLSRQSDDWLKPGVGDVARAFGSTSSILTTASEFSQIPMAGGLIIRSIRESLCKDFTWPQIESITTPNSNETQ